MRRLRSALYKLRWRRRARRAQRNAALRKSAAILHAPPLGPPSNYTVLPDDYDKERDE